MEVALPDVGEIIAGHMVLRVVGEGSMGMVYEARGTRDEPVALKILKPDRARDAEAVRDFRNEAEATGAVEHEGVVNVFQHGEEGGRHFIVMEFVDGGPLELLLKRKDRIPWKPAVNVTIQVANALSHAHGMGLVHRDIKPGNILLYKDGRTRLTDFGIVKDISSLKGFLLNGKQVGTAGYASPEQCLGKRVSHATDIYSLGATLYHMLCGRMPFEGASQNEVLNRTVKEKLRPPVRRVADMPKALSNTVEKMLAKKQTERHEDMSCVAADLELILEGKIPMAGMVRRRRIRR